MRKLAEKLEAELDELEYAHGILEGALHKASIQLNRSQKILNDLKTDIEENEDG